MRRAEMSGVEVAIERPAALDCREALADPALPWLWAALDPREIERTIAPIVADVAPERGRARMLEAELVRYKPGRRCVVYYEFEHELEIGRRIAVYAKIRARGADLRTQRLLLALEEAGLDHARGGRIGVPHPIGAVPELNLSLQLACPGEIVTRTLERADGVRVMERVAEALSALHRAGVEARRSHSIADELAILRTRLGEAARLAPHRRERIERVLDACCALAGRLEAHPTCGLHRDFYPDQVLVDDTRVTLLDLDLFAAGDPAVDVGNFSGHLIEQSMRTHGEPDRFDALMEAFEEGYLALAPQVPSNSVRTYRILTLARHIHLSMVLPGRAELTGPLLEYCEAELDLAARGAAAQKFSRIRSEAR